MIRAPVLCGTLLVCACHGLDPCYELKVGDRVQITVTAPVEENQLQPCNAGLDFAAGQVSVFTVQGFEGDTTCKAATGTLTAVGGWTWEPDYQLSTHGMGRLIDGLGLSASRGDCQGVVDLALEMDRPPDSALVPGVPAEGTLRRGFSGPGTATCPISCSGGFLVEVEKL
jgi:hypothetical protein